MPELMTISEYARHRGCDEKQVRRALAAGTVERIGGDRRCIDADRADAAWPPSERMNRRGMPADAGIAAHRLRRMKAEADKAELIACKMAAALVDRNDAERTVFEAFHALRDACLAACRTCAPAAALLSDVREIQHVLEDGYRDAFSAFESAMSARVQEAAPAGPTGCVGMPAAQGCV